MSIAYLALGSNLGNPLEQLQGAVEALALLPDTRVTAVSKVYETDPWGVEEQPDFLNAVVEVETGLSPRALLGACLGIESAAGRIRLLKNGPRVLDVDLLLYGQVTSDDPELILPHPRMWERSFVLVPLADIYPPATVPLEKVGRAGVRNTAFVLRLPEA